MQIPISRRRLCALLPLFPAAKALLAQQSAPVAAPPNPQSAPAPPAPAAPAKPQNPTFTADVNLVNLFATVRDKDSHIVANLNKEDFVLQEDGRPQVIRYFSRENDLPLALGLLVDTSRSQLHLLRTHLARKQGPGVRGPL